MSVMPSVWACRAKIVMRDARLLRVYMGLVFRFKKAFFNSTETIQEFRNRLAVHVNACRHDCMCLFVQMCYGKMERFDVMCCKELSSIKYKFP